MEDLEPTLTTEQETTETARQLSLNRTLLIVGTFIVIAVAAGSGYYFGSKRAVSMVPSSTPEVTAQPSPTLQPNETEGVFCTMDAKICPDGSAVGRSGPNCEFAPCPGEKENEPTNSLVSIFVQGGLCQTGVCRQTIKISQEGTVTRDGSVIDTLTADELTNLKSAIEDTDFEAIKAKPFTDTCPVAYDGQEIIYTFETANEIIATCTYDVDESLPVFQFLSQFTEST